MLSGSMQKVLFSIIIIWKKICLKASNLMYVVYLHIFSAAVIFAGLLCFLGSFEIIRLSGSLYKHKLEDLRRRNNFQSLVYCVIKLHAWAKLLWLLIFESTVRVFLSLLFCLCCIKSNLEKGQFTEKMTELV